MNANVYEADIAKVKPGYPVMVYPLSYPGKSFAGKIDKISEVLDPQSKTMRVRVDIQNDDMLLKPDMFVKVTVSNKETGTAICIPSSAVISQDGKDYAVVYNSDEDMKIAEISILKTSGTRTYLKSGLTPGQRVITQNELFIFNQLLNE